MFVSWDTARGARKTMLPGGVSGSFEVHIHTGSTILYAEGEERARDKKLVSGADTYLDLGHERDMVI